MKKVKKLDAKIKDLDEKIEDLTQQLLKNHAAKNERMTMLLRQLSHSPSGPSS